jgi:nucleotidyltransferase substrate binding protein (TIGR01987 family)
MKNPDIRWQQRFQNFETAFTRLREALNVVNPSELERNGLVQRFEFTLELCWNTLKDYLQSEGFEFKPTPKETIRQAFKSGIISNAQDLIDGLDIRNELSHDYSGQKFMTAETEIRGRVYPAIETTYRFFLETMKNKG